MNKMNSRNITKYSTFGMMVITVSFFLTQVYSPLFTTSDGNLIIALVILGTFLCGRTYGVTAGVILSIFVLVMRFLSVFDGFTPGHRADLSGKFYRNYERFERDVTKTLNDVKNKTGTYANLSEFQYQKACRDTAEVEYKKARKFCGVSNRQIGRLSQSIYGTPQNQPYLGVQYNYPSEAIARDNRYPKKVEEGRKVTKYVYVERDGKSERVKLSGRVTRVNDDATLNVSYDDGTQKLEKLGDVNLDYVAGSGPGKWFGKINWNPVPDNAGRTNLLKGRDLYKLDTWLSNDVAKLILGPSADLSGKTYMDLIATFYSGQRHCTLEPMFLKAKNASPADAPGLLIKAYERMLKFAEKGKKDFSATLIGAEKEVRAGLTDEQKKIRNYALLARDLAFNDNSDGARQRRFNAVNNEKTLEAAKAKYEELKGQYAKEEMSNRLVKMKYAIMSRDLPFPITNSDTARKMRYDTVMGMPTTGQSKWKYERDYLPRSKAEISQQEAIKTQMEKAGFEREKLQKELDAQAAKIKKDQEQAEEELRKAKLDAEKIRDQAKKEQEEIERKARERAAELLKKAGADGAALADKLKADAEALAKARREAAEASANKIEKKAAQDAADAKRRADAERKRLSAYEDELTAERDRAEAAERMAAKQRLRVEKQLRQARQIERNAEQAGINVREELARERERRSAAEKAVFIEQTRADSIKAKERAVCRTARNKARTRQERLDMVRRQREQQKADAERARKEAEQKEKDRLMTLKRIRMTELAADRMERLYALRNDITENNKLRKKQDEARQVNMSSELLSGQGSKQGGSLGVLPVGSSGKFSSNEQYALNEINGRISKNSYLERGKADSLFVDRTTLGGYVGPANYQLYTQAGSVSKK